MILSFAVVTGIRDFDEEHTQVEGRFFAPLHHANVTILFVKPPYQFVNPPEPGEEFEFAHVLKKPIDLKVGDKIPIQFFEPGEREIRRQRIP